VQFVARDDVLPCEVKATESMGPRDDVDKSLREDPPLPTHLSYSHDRRGSEWSGAEVMGKD
jgi:hypothetical protein